MLVSLRKHITLLACAKCNATAVHHTISSTQVTRQGARLHTHSFCFLATSQNQHQCQQPRRLQRSTIIIGKKHKRQIVITDSGLMHAQLQQSTHNPVSGGSGQHCCKEKKTTAYLAGLEEPGVPPVYRLLTPHF